jgi:hypothetical protein
VKSCSALTVEEELFHFCTENSNSTTRTDTPLPIVESASSPCNNFLFTTTIPDANISPTSSSTSEKEETVHQEPQKPTLPEQSNDKHTPFTAPWIVARLRDSPGQAIGILRTWSHDKRLDVDDTAIAEINALSEETAIKAVEELKTPRAYVRGTKGTKLSLPATVVSLETRAEYKASTLLDSGCEGSCIDANYIQERGLRTTPLPRPIPVFNADGSRNAAGSITKFITLEL